MPFGLVTTFFFFKQKTAYEIGLGIPAEPLFRSSNGNHNELNQDDARYGFRCCHLKNIWTAPLPPETELSRQMTTSTTSIDKIGRASCRERVKICEIGILIDRRIIHLNLLVLF